MPKGLIRTRGQLGSQFGDRRRVGRPKARTRSKRRHAERWKGVAAPVELGEGPAGPVLGGPPGRQSSARGPKPRARSTARGRRLAGDRRTSRCPRPPRRRSCGWGEPVEHRLDAGVGEPDRPPRALPKAHSPAIRARRRQRRRAERGWRRSAKCASSPESSSRSAASASPASSPTALTKVTSCAPEAADLGIEQEWDAPARRLGRHRGDDQDLHRGCRGLLPASITLSCVLEARQDALGAEIARPLGRGPAHRLASLGVGDQAFHRLAKSLGVALRHQRAGLLVEHVGVAAEQGADHRPAPAHPLRDRRSQRLGPKRWHHPEHRLAPGGHHDLVGDVGEDDRLGREVGRRVALEGPHQDQRRLRVEVAVGVEERLQPLDLAEGADEEDERLLRKLRQPGVDVGLPLRPVSAAARPESSESSPP